MNFKLTAFFLAIAVPVSLFAASITFYNETDSPVTVTFSPYKVVSYNFQNFENKRDAVTLTLAAKETKTYTAEESSGTLDIFSKKPIMSPLGMKDFNFSGSSFKVMGGFGEQYTPEKYKDIKINEGGPNWQLWLKPA